MSVYECEKRTHAIIFIVLQHKDNLLATTATDTVILDLKYPNKYSMDLHDSVCIDIHDPHRMNSTYLGDPWATSRLTFLFYSEISRQLMPLVHISMEPRG